MTDISWRMHGSEYVYRSEWFDFRLDDVELPGGQRIEYGVFEGREIVQMLAITPDDKVVMVRQWRQPIGRTTLSLPGGIVDAGESPEEAARRELREETGYVADVVERIFRVHTSPGRTDEACSIHACRVGRRLEREPDATEYLEVVELSVDELREAVAKGEITDASSVLGLTRVL